MDVLTEAELRYLRFQAGEAPVLRKSLKYERIVQARKKLTENYLRGDTDRMVFLRNMGGLSMKVFIIYHNIQCNQFHFFHLQGARMIESGGDRPAANTVSEPASNVPLDYDSDDSLR